MKLKLPSWKQDEPQQQMAVLVQSVWGDISNIRDGIVSPDRLPIVHQRIEKTLDELLQLREWVSKEW